MKTVKVSSLVALIAALMTYTAQGQSRNASFASVPEKATFIHGEDLVTAEFPETGQSVGVETQARKVAGLSAVMVTPNGNQYESKIDPADIALFEAAIRGLERSGRMATFAGSRPTIPMRGTIDGEDGYAPQVVIPVGDQRVQVTNTVASPYWYYGRIAVGCTGTLITAKHVLTAGHCVSNGAGSWYSSLNFTVAQNGTYQPWGTKTWTRAITTSAWHNNADSNHDYALIVLSAPAHGGWSGWGVFSGGTHRISGYPGDKPSGTMWTMAGSVSTSGSYRLCYTIDTAGGQSGSGIVDSAGYVRGVHTTGSLSGNCGTRLTSGVYNTLQNWIATYPN